ncbi:tetratricopeptide repeat protein [Marinilabiliaceae bacterium JC017]|nr:tetratricopeptide repeat protein [Marinilabiliaceae bacterium JC017]
MKKLLFVLFVLGFFTAKGQNPDVIKSDAIIQEGRMQYLKAAELYAEAAKVYQSTQVTDTFCVYKAGQNYVRAKKYSTGLTYLQQAESLHFSDETMYLSLADVYSGLKKYQDAENMLSKGMETYPALKADYTKKMAFLLYNSKQYKNAVHTLEEALGVYPRDITLLYLKGSSLERLNQYEGASKVFEEVLKLNPNHKKSITKLGVVFFKQTDAIYIQETKRYENLKNPSRIDYHNSVKKLETISRGYEKAIPYLEKAYALNGKNKQIISCLYVAYRRLKMEEKAVEMKLLLE